MALYVYTDSDLRDALRQRVHDAGSQRAFARQHGINHAYLSRILAQKRPVGKLVAGLLGYRLIRGRTYTPAADDNNQFFDL